MLVSSLPKNEQELIEYCRHCNTRGQACGIRFMLRRGFNRKQIAREMNMTIEQVIEDRKSVV